MKPLTWLKNNKYLACFISILIIYFLNMFIDIMDIDASQYAEISWEMLTNGSYLEVYNRGHDYLDKPPLLFWLAATSFKLFGISNFTYKLPAVLCLLLGIYSVYKFTLGYYDKKRALMAALILATTQAFFLMTNDIRTDGLLTGFTFFAVWQMSDFLRKERLIHLLLGAVSLGLAMMAKGPLALIIAGFAIGSDLLVKRQWKQILDVRWILFLIIVGICLIPMCYGLYTQYDLHPEKETYGLKGPSGIKFFFWTQSFGRITGDSSWKDETGFFYFFQTLVWDFQPWVLFFLPALYVKIKDLVKSRFRVPNSVEFISFGGFFFTFFALSISRYKLPHYIFPLFPFLAIMVADYIFSLSKSGAVKIYNFLKTFQLVTLNLFFVAIMINFIFFFPPTNIYLPAVVIILYLLFWINILRTSDKSDKVVIPTLITSIAVGLVMSTNFYPSLLKYQSKSVVGKYIHEAKIPEDKFYFYNLHSYSMDFYARRIVQKAEPSQMESFSPHTLIYTDEDGKNQILDQWKLNYKVVNEYDDFGVTMLNIEFLRKEKRAGAVRKAYLLEKSGQ